MLAREATRTWRRLCRDVRALPPGAWRTFGVTLGGGFAACGLLTAAGTLAARRLAADGLAAWDRASLERLIALLPDAFHAAILFESPANFLYLIPLTLAGATAAIRHGRPLHGLGLLATYYAGRALVWIGWLSWDRPRPDVVAGGIAAPPLHSFPSGHAAFAVLVYGFLAWWWAQSTRSRAERLLAGVLAAAVALAVGLARLRLGTHWPSDVAAGWLLGAAWLLVVITAVRRAERQAAAGP